MKDGDIVLTPLPQADGEVKPRPVLLLCRLPPFQDFLACGISSQIRHAVPGFDEILRRSDPACKASGLLTDSVIRLGFLATLPQARIGGGIGYLPAEKHRRLLESLSRLLLQA